MADSPVHLIQRTIHEQNSSCLKVGDVHHWLEVVRLKEDSPVYLVAWFTQTGTNVQMAGGILASGLSDQQKARARTVEQLRSEEGSRWGAS